MPIQHQCIRWENWKMTLHFHIHIGSTGKINVSKSGNLFFMKYLPLLDIIHFNLKQNYFTWKYFPLSSLISYKQCGTVVKLLSSLSAIFRDSSRNQVLEFRKKTLALINNCCKNMIKRKKYTSNCIYQSYLSFLRFVQMQLNLWILIFLEIKFWLKTFKWLSLKVFLNHTTLYNVFSLSMTAARQKLLHFHSNYSLQNTKNKMSLYNSNIVAVAAPLTAGLWTDCNTCCFRQRQLRGRWGMFDSYKVASTMTWLESMDSSGARKEETAHRISSWW